MKKKTIIFSIAILLAVSALFIFCSPVDRANAQTNENDGAVTGWMWSSNLGWIKADSNSTNPVKVDSSGQFSGYAWGSNVGWIDFNPVTTPTDNYPGEPRHGVKLAGDSVIGWARACSVFASGCSGALKPESARGGWYGWIKMINVVRNPENGGLNGFAWGDLNLGWLSFGLHRDDGGGNPPDECNPAIQVCTGGGGGSSVACVVEPTLAPIGMDVLYTAEVSGGTGSLYQWSSASDEGLGSSLPDETSNTFLTSYPNPGLYQVFVEVFDEEDNPLGSADCNQVNICVPDGSPVPEDQGICCNEDIDGDGLCGEQTDTPCLLDLPPQENNYISYYEPDEMSSVNALITPTGCTDGPFTLNVNNLPPALEPVCAFGEGEEYTSDNCQGVTSAPFWLGVKHVGPRPAGFVSGQPNETMISVSLDSGDQSGTPISLPVDYWIPIET